MWSPNTRRESDEDDIAENLIFAGTSEAPFGVKRQRRPSVRLEDLGDQHAAPSADKRKKKLGVCVLPHAGKGPTDSNENLPLASFVPNNFRTGKALNTKPGVCASNGGLHKCTSFDDGDDAQRAELSLSCCMDGSAEPHPAFEKVTSKNKLQQLLRITSKKVRNGSRKPGVPKMAASVKKSPSTPRSGTLTTRARSKCKVSGMQNVKDMHFDKENSTHTPAGFEASGYHNVISTLERRGHLEHGEMAMLHSHLKHQSGGDWPARAQIRGGRTNQSSNKRQAFKLTDGERLAQANGSRHVPKGKLIIRENGALHVIRNNLVVDDNGNGGSRDPSINNAKQHMMRQCSRPWLGVREWLQDLGLGKYAELFEAHEVEPEVLPLLTLDDLREMGVAAVGSRRKMLYAIQHFKKALLAEAD